MNVACAIVGPANTSGGLQSALDQNVTICRATRIASLDAPTWDALTRDASFFLQRRYLAALELVLPPSIRPCYALTYCGGRPVMAVSAQVLTVTQDYLDRAGGSVAAARHAASTSVRDAAGRYVRGALLRGLFRHVLICGSLFTTGSHGVSCIPEFRSQAPLLLAQTLAQLRLLLHDAQPTGFTVVKDPGDGEFDGLALSGFRRCPSEPEMVLNLDPAWIGHDDYLRAMRSRYRRAARLIFDRCNHANVELVRPASLEGLDAQLYPLYEQVEHRAKIRVSSMPPGFLAALSRAAGPDAFRCSIAQISGEIAGFLASVRDGDTAMALCAGFDYRVLRETPIYLRLLHAAVEDALSMGCRRISFGRMACEPKARLGAQPLTRWIWMRHRRPLLNAALTPLLSRIPHEPIPERHVFRGA